MICWIALESGSKAFCLLKPVAISLEFFFKISKIQETTSRVIITLGYRYFSDFIVLLNRVINWIIIKTYSINFNIVLLTFKLLFFERAIGNVIISCCIIISKNKQSFNFLITWIEQFSCMFFCISSSNLYYFIVNYLVFVSRNRSFKSFV